MTIKELTKFKTWSTFFYFVPFLLAIHYQIAITIIFLGLLILVCLYYHFTSERKFGRLDHLLAWIVIITNTIICYQGGFAMPFFAITLLLVIVSLIVYTKFTRKSEYNKMHGIWHIISALITIFSIFTFASGMHL